MSEKQKYLTSIEEDVKSGLKDVKFFPGNIFDASEEAVYAELNRLNVASDLPDTELLEDDNAKLSDAQVVNRK